MAIAVPFIMPVGAYLISVVRYRNIKNRQTGICGIRYRIKNTIYINRIVLPPDLYIVFADYKEEFFLFSDIESTESHQSAHAPR